MALSAVEIIHHQLVSRKAVNNELESSFGPKWGADLLRTLTQTSFRTTGFQGEIWTSSPEYELTLLDLDIQQMLQCQPLAYVDVILTCLALILLRLQRAQKWYCITSVWLEVKKKNGFLLWVTIIKFVQRKNEFIFTASEKSFGRKNKKLE